MAFINNTQDGFTVVLNKVAQNSLLSLEEKGMLLHLLSLPSSTDWNLSVEGLSRIMPEGKDKIRRVLNDLIKKGYLVKYQVQGSDGRFTHNDYEVFQEPQTPINTKFTPSPENPTTVEPPQKNKNLKNKYNRVSSSYIYSGIDIAESEDDLTTTDDLPIPDPDVEETLDLNLDTAKEIILEASTLEDVTLTPSEVSEKAQKLVSRQPQNPLNYARKAVKNVPHERSNGSAKAPQKPKIKRMMANEYSKEQLNELEKMLLDHDRGAPRAAPT